MTSGGRDWTYFLVNRVVRSGIHYFEFLIHLLGEFPEYQEPPLAAFWGVTDGHPLTESEGKPKDPNTSRYGLLNYRVTISSESGEQQYGEILFPNRVLGMLIDVDEGELSFDAVNVPSLIENPQAISEFWHPFGLSPLPRLPDTIAPMVGLKYPAASIEVLPKHYSIAGTSNELMLHSLGSLMVLLPRFLQQDETSAELPAGFLQTCYNKWKDWHLQRTRRHLVRPGRYEAVFDVLPSSVRAFNGFLAGDTISTPNGDAVVVGVLAGSLWYQVIGHERWGAWFCTLEELNATGTEFRLLKRSPTPVSSSDLFSRYVSFEQFSELVNSCELSDVEIVEIVNRLSQSVRTQNLTPQVFLESVDNSLRKHFRTASLLAVSCRFSVLLSLNELCSLALPLIDFDRTPVFAQDSGTQYLDPLSLASLVANCRHLLFMETKNRFLQELLLRTRVDTGVAEEMFSLPRSISEYSVNRGINLNQYSDPMERCRKSLLGQLFNALRHSGDEDYPLLRQMFVPLGAEDRQPRAFKLKLIGEGALDDGGPYREVFMQIFEQLHSLTSSGSPLLPLFAPCPNYRSKDVINKHLWVINPTRKSSEDIRLYQFVGTLIGMAIRHNIPLSGIQWPTMYWKVLANQPISVADLREFDTDFYDAHYQVWQSILDDDKRAALLATSSLDSADSLLELNEIQWQVYSSITQEWVPLRDDTPYVTFSELPQYVEQAVKYRLEEVRLQLDAILEGINTILPVWVFQLFTAKDLAQLITGPTEIDIQRLKAHTKYEGVDPDAPFIHYFWEALEEMDNVDRSEFLQFAWSRSRLPISDDQWDRPLTIKPMNDSAHPDQCLITVRTCFFTLNLPAYSSKKIMVEKIHYVKQVREQDADFKGSDTSSWRL